MQASSNATQHAALFHALLQAGRIVHIIEAAEQVVKMPQAVLPVAGAAAPLLQALRSSPLGSLVPGGLAAGMPIAAAAAATSQQPQQAFYASAPAQPQASSSFGSPPADMAAAGRTRGASSSSSSSSPKARSSSIPAAVPPAANGSSGGSGGVGGSSDPGKIAGLAGVWIKDQAASDAVSYGRACDLLQASRAWGYVLGLDDWLLNAPPHALLLCCAAGCCSLAIASRHALQLSGLQKTTAMQLIEGVEIEQQGSQVAIRFLTGER